MGSREDILMEFLAVLMLNVMAHTHAPNAYLDTNLIMASAVIRIAKTIMKETVHNVQMAIFSLKTTASNRYPTAKALIQMEFVLNVMMDSCLKTDYAS